ncbi:MAG: hypothetical protein A4E20_01285 [Nitrospira sp. SG-bin2]|uniref:hypothetical protein n=1 Tax=Nitrospira cf. moscoviensis SBR1015 TaxID=96242 RepID=UPI000A0A81EB|nr:hypothetical protein [Nitrospira cf. moscoviensis SBR1015]OQW34837.1 MAG: hypothetical protein A4E20_01285 [Nitrospira sp. SG-bin2]
MSEALVQAERRLRHGVPLRLDQVTDLMQEGVDARMVQQNIEREESPFNWADPDDEDYSD